MVDLEQRLAKASVLVVGDVMLDRYWFGDVERISPEAPVPIVRVQREEYRPGGAANVAANVAALGASVALLSVIGDDEAGKILSNAINNAGIKPYLSVDPQLSTTVKLRVSGRQQQLLRIDFENQPHNNALETMADSFREIIDDYDIVVISDYGKGGLNRVSDIIDVAGKAGKPVLVDPKGRDYSAYHGATIITPNRSELAQVVGNWGSESQLETLATQLCDDLNIAALLVTRSEEGMSLFENDSHYRIAAAARDVFDVTGAGDTVIATLATLVAAGMSLRDAIVIANKAAGIVVGKFGTSVISYEELFA